MLVFSAFFLLPTKTFASNPPNQWKSIYSSPGTPIPADGITTGTITVNLRDSDGNYVTGDTITLSSSNNSHAVFNNSQITGASGNATFTITSTIIGTTKVTLSDNTNVATFTDWFTVTFYSPTLGCSSAPGAPVLTSVTSNSNYTATLTWADSPNPVSNYVVSYGVTSGQYVYGNTNIGAQGTTSYIVGSLSGNKKYYFVVAATNNCGAGRFSNEMSAVVNPVPTPVPIVVETTKPTATPQSAGPTISVTPTGTPIEVGNTPTPEATIGGNSTIKTVAIILIVSGFTIIGSLFVILKIAKKKRQGIPPMLQTPKNGSASLTTNSPPVPPVPLVPPTDENPPLKKQ